jgi:hypothetical protein
VAEADLGLSDPDPALVIKLHPVALAGRHRGVTRTLKGVRVRRSEGRYGPLAAPAGGRRARGGSRAARPGRSSGTGDRRQEPEPARPAARPVGSPDADEHSPADLSDLLEELRILLQGTQVLTAFLIILPFQQGFPQIQPHERWIYLATFVCSVSSLVLFSAPAAQHRLERPLRSLSERVRFKVSATRLTITGLIPFSLALPLATHLVVTVVLGATAALATAALVAVLIGALWWAVPLAARQRRP